MTLLLSVSVVPSRAEMKGPDARRHRHAPDEKIETSAARIVLDGAYRFFRDRISPIDGDRCGFRPTCSTYAHRALSERGLLTGLMLTGDRLIRCHPWKKAGADYTLLPNGRLHDPLSRNIIADR